MNLYSKTLSTINEEKNNCVGVQDYENAASLRDMEKALINTSFDNYNKIRNYIRYVKAQSYYNDIAKKCIAPLLTFVDRKSKLEKLEKLY
jgi:hypothetical protein